MQYSKRYFERYFDFCAPAGFREWSTSPQFITTSVKPIEDLRKDHKFGLHFVHSKHEWHLGLAAKNLFVKRVQNHGRLDV